MAGSRVALRRGGRPLKFQSLRASVTEAKGLVLETAKQQVTNCANSAVSRGVTSFNMRSKVQLGSLSKSGEPGIT